MKPEISIIVPIYNAESCISQCIDSILSQSFTDFELLLIDDGSIDNSGRICDEYAAFDSRVVVIHQKNSGVSLARNRGLEEAKGNYVTFIDADDYVKTTYLTSLWEGEKADLVIGGYISIEEEGSVPFLFSHNYYLKRNDIGPFLENNLDTLILRTPWGKLFNLHIINQYSICFDTNLFFGEDTLFVQNYLLKTGSIRCSVQADYIYKWSPNWSIKYCKDIQNQVLSFNKICNCLKLLSCLHKMSVEKAEDKFVYIFSLIFQSYMSQTPWKDINKIIVSQFFSNRLVQNALGRLKANYRNMYPFYFLSKKNMFTMIVFYSKLYHLLKVC